MIAISLDTAGPRAGVISLAGRMVYGGGTFWPPTAMIGGAFTGSPSICDCGGGAGCERQSPPGAVPPVTAKYRVSVEMVSAIEPPPAGDGRRAPHGYKRSVAGGWVVGAAVPAEQSPLPPGAPSARPAR